MPTVDTPPKVSTIKPLPEAPANPASITAGLSAATLAACGGGGNEGSIVKPLGHSACGNHARTSGAVFVASFFGLHRRQHQTSAQPRLQRLD